MSIDLAELYNKWKSNAIEAPEPPPPSSSTDPIRVLYLHGWGASPFGNKPTYLRQNFAVYAPKLFLHWVPFAISTAAEELNRVKPHVVVGSSMGGLVALALLRSGVWNGPTVLIAPALSLPLPLYDVYHFKTGAEQACSLVLMHGSQDSIIPFRFGEYISSCVDALLVDMTEGDDVPIPDPDGENKKIFVVKNDVHELPSCCFNEKEDNVGNLTGAVLWAKKADKCEDPSVHCHEMTIWMKIFVFAWIVLNGLWMNCIYHTKKFLSGNEKHQPEMSQVGDGPKDKDQ